MLVKVRTIKNIVHYLTTKNEKTKKKSSNQINKVQNFFVTSLILLIMKRRQFVMVARLQRNKSQFYLTKYTK